MPIRITFVLLHLDPGGLERIVCNLLHNLSPEEFECRVVFIQRPGLLAETLPAHVETHLLGQRARWSVPGLRQLIRRHQPDIVFSGTVQTNIVSIIATRALAPRPRVMLNEHTPPTLMLAHRRGAPLLRRLMRLFYPAADLLGVPHERIGTELTEMIGASSGLRIVALDNPVLPPYPVARTRSVKPMLKDPPVVLGVGRLVREKEFGLLIEAFARLENYPSSLLTILGEGPDRERLTRLGEDLGLGQRLRLPGQVEDPEAYYREASVLVVASRREAVPNVLVEAMAVGCPVIATDSWVGTRDLLLDGRAGLIVPPDNRLGLTAAIDRILSDHELADNLAQRGAEVAERHRVDRAVPRYAAAFKELAARKLEP